jgi:hypothetical protein
VAVILDIEKVKIVFGKMLSPRRQVGFGEEYACVQSEDMIVEEYGMVDWLLTQEFVVSDKAKPLL